MNDMTHYSPASVIVARLQQDLGLDYGPVSISVYGTLLDLGMILKIGDSIETPDGTMLTCTFKPGN